MTLALFSFYFFQNIGLKTIYAFIYSLGVSVLAYPSIGTPFVDHHAVIFSVMALYSLSMGILLKKNLFWFLTPIFLAFSFFSNSQKSTPNLGIFLSSTSHMALVDYFIGRLSMQGICKKCELGSIQMSFRTNPSRFNTFKRVF